MLGGVKSKAEPATLNMLGTLMGENTKHVRKATGKASNETVGNRGRLLRFVENIVEEARALVCPNDASGMLELYHEDKKQAAAFDETSPTPSLSPPAGWGLALGSDGQDQKRPKNKKTRREPHLTQRT